MLTFMLALACTAALKDDIADLEAELEDLESQVEELEDGDDDTAAPVDTGDTQEEDEVVLAPSVRLARWEEGDGYHAGYVVSGDVLSVYAAFSANNGWEYSDGLCEDFTIGESSSFSLYVETWDMDGVWQCWTLNDVANPDCIQMVFLPELTCAD